MGKKFAQLMTVFVVGKRHWKPLAFDVAGATIHKRGYELRRHGAAIESAEWSVSDFVEVRGAFEGAIELSPARAHAGLAGPASQHLQQAAVR